MSKIEIHIKRPHKDNPEVSTVIDATVEYEWMSFSDLCETIKVLGGEVWNILTNGSNE